MPDSTILPAVPAKATPPSTGGAPAPVSAAPVTTTSMNNPLAGMGTVSQEQPALHQNPDLSQALYQAFAPPPGGQPQAPPTPPTENLLGAVLARLQNQVAPVAYYQPRRVGKI